MTPFGGSRPVPRRVGLQASGFRVEGLMDAMVHDFNGSQPAVCLSEGRGSLWNGLKTYPATRTSCCHPLPHLLIHPHAPQLAIYPPHECLKHVLLGVGSFSSSSYGEGGHSRNPGIFEHFPLKLHSLSCASQTRIPVTEAPTLFLLINALARPKNILQCLLSGTRKP